MLATGTTSHYLMSDPTRVVSGGPGARLPRRGKALPMNHGRAFPLLGATHGSIGAFDQERTNARALFAGEFDDAAGPPFAGHHEVQIFVGVAPHPVARAVNLAAPLGQTLSFRA